MIIDYPKLLNSIRQLIIDNPKILDINFDDNSIQYQEDKDICFLSRSLFMKEVKKPFEQTVINIGGHHESYFDNKTVKDILENNKTSRFINEIEDSIINNLKSLIISYAKSVKSGFSDEVIENNFNKEIACILSFPVIHDDYCFICGQRSDYFIIDGEISHKNTKDTKYWQYIDEPIKPFIDKDHNNKPCSFPNGIEKYEFEYVIESNQLLFANDLREIYNIDYKTMSDYIYEQCGYHTDINSEAGVMYHQKLWNDKGLIYIQTGNTSPILMKDSVNGTIIAIDPNVKITSKNYDFPLDVSRMKKVGFICTDLWAVNLIDVAKVKTYARKKGISLDDALSRLGGNIIDVEPGKYKIVCYNAHHYLDRPVFFSLEKVS